MYLYETTLSYIDRMSMCLSTLIFIPYLCVVCFETDCQSN